MSSEQYCIFQPYKKEEANT